jgi:hypothetical protein
VDEFCAKNRVVRCKSFKETMETVGRDAFKMFLGVSAVVEGWSPDGASCSLRMPDNPLAGEREGGREQVGRRGETDGRGSRPTPPRL